MTTFWPKRDKDGRHVRTTNERYIIGECGGPELNMELKPLSEPITCDAVKFKLTHKNNRTKHPKCNICKDTGEYRYRKGGLLFVSICNCSDHLCKTCGESKYMLSTAPLNTGIISDYFACLNNECVPE